VDAGPRPDPASPRCCLGGPEWQTALPVGVVKGDGNEADAEWQRQALEIISPEVLAGSLPHRSDDERQQIARAFLDATTRHKVCATLEIPWTVVIAEVVAEAR